MNIQRIQRLLISTDETVLEAAGPDAFANYDTTFPMGNGWPWLLLGFSLSINEAVVSGGASGTVDSMTLSAQMRRPGANGNQTTYNFRDAAGNFYLTTAPSIDTTTPSTNESLHEELYLGIGPTNSAEKFAISQHPVIMPDDVIRFRLRVDQAGDRTTLAVTALLYEAIVAQLGN